MAMATFLDCLNLHTVTGVGCSDGSFFMSSFTDDCGVPAQAGRGVSSPGSSFSFCGKLSALGLPIRM